MTSENISAAVALPDRTDLAATDFEDRALAANNIRIGSDVKYRSADVLRAFRLGFTSRDGAAWVFDRSSDQFVIEAVHTQEPVR